MILTEQQVAHLSQQAEQQAASAAVVLEQAIDLREAIYRIFSTLAGGQAAAADDLAILNGVLHRALNRLRIAQAEAGFAWEWLDDGIAGTGLGLPVARSAANLLTSAQLDRVKVCEDDRGCGFLFLDTSRNRSRRWCDMKGCGNRAKVRRYRKRQTESSS